MDAELVALLDTEEERAHMRLLGMCAARPPADVAGLDIACMRPAHPRGGKHMDRITGWGWWGEAE